MTELGILFWNLWIDKSPLALFNTLNTQRWDACWIKHVSLLLFLLHSQHRHHGALLWDHDVCAAGVLDLLAAGRDGLLLQEDLQVWWADAGHSVSVQTHSRTQTQIRVGAHCAYLKTRLLSTDAYCVLTFVFTRQCGESVYLCVPEFLLFKISDVCQTDRCRRQSRGSEGRTERKGRVTRGR